MCSARLLYRAGARAFELGRGADQPRRRHRIAALLFVLNLVFFLPTMVSLFLGGALVVFVINPWATRARARSGAGFFLGALGRVAICWGPFLAAAIWSRTAEYILAGGGCTLLWLWAMFSRSGRSSGGTWLGSSGGSWSSGSSSSSDLFSGGGGSFGGGGASGDW